MEEKKPEEKKPEEKKPEVIEYWLSQPMFIKQAGQVEPEYVRASPTSPVKVVLPADVKTEGVDILADGRKKVRWHSPHLKPVHEGRPDKPKVPHPAMEPRKLKNASEAIKDVKPAAK